MDCPNAGKPEDIAIALGLQNSSKKPPIIVVNPTQKASITEALKVLISEIIKPSIL